MKTKRRKPPRHAFRFQVQTGDRPKTLTVWTEVRRAIKPVELILTADDVLASMRQKGVGNTQTCAMAVCAKRHADAFPHPVEGFIDWQYRTAYVVSRTSRATGLPSHSVVYDHNDRIAQLNDSRGGQKQLLAQLEKNGPRVVRLLPGKWRKRRQGKPPGKRDGSRSRRVLGIGAKLRFAVASLGGVPQG